MQILFIFSIIVGSCVGDWSASNCIVGDNTTGEITHDGFTRGGGNDATFNFTFGTPSLDGRPIQASILQRSSEPNNHSCVSWLHRYGDTAAVYFTFDTFFYGENDKHACLNRSVTNYTFRLSIGVFGNCEKAEPTPFYPVHYIDKDFVVNFDDSGTSTFALHVDGLIGNFDGDFGSITAGLTGSDISLDMFINGGVGPKTIDEGVVNTTLMFKFGNETWECEYLTEGDRFIYVTGMVLPADITTISTMLQSSVDECAVVVTFAHGLNCDSGPKDYCNGVLDVSFNTNHALVSGVGIDDLKRRRLSYYPDVTPQSSKRRALHALSDGVFVKQYEFSVRRHPHRYYDDDGWYYNHSGTGVFVFGVCAIIAICMCFGWFPRKYWATRADETGQDTDRKALTFSAIHTYSPDGNNEASKGKGSKNK